MAHWDVDVNVIRSLLRIYYDCTVSGFAQVLESGMQNSIGKYGRLTDSMGKCCQGKIAWRPAVAQLESLRPLEYVTMGVLPSEARITCICRGWGPMPPTPMGAPGLVPGSPCRS